MIEKIGRIMLAWLIGTTTIFGCVGWWMTYDVMVKGATFSYVRNK